MTRPAFAEDFIQLLSSLNTDGFPDKTKAVEAIAASGNPRAVIVLQALLNDSLQTRAGDSLVVVVQGSGVAQTLVDARHRQEPGARTGRRSVPNFRR